MHMPGRNLSRRELIIAGMSLTLAGCAEKMVGTTNRPRPWPVLAERPRGTTGTAGTAGRASTPALNVRRPPTTVPQPPRTTLSVIPRSAWARGAPISARLGPMQRIERITVHHEGWTTVQFSDQSSTARRLESIRRSHLQRLNAGDIGYHYIIDRAGRVWQGRDLRYQGAHVRHHNSHNIGVMVLGNFDQQRPTPAQYTTLHRTLGNLMQRYGVNRPYVFTHQELGPTSCPGTSLQQHMVYARRNAIV